MLPYAAFDGSAIYPFANQTVDTSNCGWLQTAFGSSLWPSGASCALTYPDGFVQLVGPVARYRIFPYNGSTLAEAGPDLAKAELSCTGSVPANVSLSAAVTGGNGASQTLATVVAYVPLTSTDETEKTAETRALRAVTPFADKAMAKDDTAAAPDSWWDYLLSFSLTGG